MTETTLYYVRLRECYRQSGDFTAIQTRYDGCKFFSFHSEAEAYAASQLPPIEANPLAKSFFSADDFPQEKPLTSQRWLQQFTTLLREQGMPPLTNYLRAAHRDHGGPLVPWIYPVVDALDEWWWHEVWHLDEKQYRAVWEFADSEACLVTAVTVHPETVTADALVCVDALLQPWGGLQSEYPLPPPVPEKPSGRLMVWDDSEDDDEFWGVWNGGRMLPPPSDSDAPPEKPEYSDPFFP
jgi:hypothetical protein